MSDERTVQKSLEEIRRDLAAGKDRTDWPRLEEMTDADIERAVSNDPDAMLLDDDWLCAARVVRPTGQK